MRLGGSTRMRTEAPGGMSGSALRRIPPHRAVAVRRSRRSKEAGREGESRDRETREDGRSGDREEARSTHGLIARGGAARRDSSGRRRACRPSASRGTSGSRQARVVHQVRNAARPMGPRPMCSCRSTREPRGFFESLTWTPRPAQSPTVDRSRRSSRVALAGDDVVAGGVDVAGVDAGRDAAAGAHRAQDVREVLEAVADARPWPAAVSSRTPTRAPRVRSKTSSSDAAIRATPADSPSPRGRRGGRRGPGSRAVSAAVDLLEGRRWTAAQRRRPETRG